MSGRTAEQQKLFEQSGSVELKNAKLGVTDWRNQ